MQKSDDPTAAPAQTSQDTTQARRRHDFLQARRWHDFPEARRWHDMGGDAAGPVPSDQHDYSMFEKRVDALMMLCFAKGLFTVDAMRRVLEDMAPDSFDTMTYYERWVSSLNTNLIESGTYTTAELAEKMAQVAARGQTYGEASAP